MNPANDWPCHAELIETVGNFLIYRLDDMVIHTRSPIIKNFWKPAGYILVGTPYGPIHFDWLLDMVEWLAEGNPTTISSSDMYDFIFSSDIIYNITYNEQLKWDYQEAMYSAYYY